MRSSRSTLGRVLAGLLAAGVIWCAVLAGGVGDVSATQSRAPAGGTDAGKLLVVGSSVFPPTLDPTSNPSRAIDEVVDYNVFQHLVELAPDGRIVPTLATSWTLSRSRMLYTFTIRKDVHFSNGDLLTPADVVFSMRRVLTEKEHPYPDAKVFDVASARVEPGNKVAVTLLSPSWSFLFDLAAYSNGVVLDPRVVSKLATDPIGTGPYVIKSERVGSKVTLGLNTGYWGTLPGVGGVEFRYFTHPSAEDAALESGQIDVIDNLGAPEEAAILASDPKRYVVLSGLTNGKVQLSINDTAAPFRSKLVREALEYAIDKQAVVDVASAGRGLPIGTDSVPVDPYYLDLANLYPYNPEKAKALLNQAGYPSGFSTTLTLPPCSYAQLAGPIIEQELAEVGINATIQQDTLPLWVSQVFDAGSFDLTVIDQAGARDVADYATPGYYWHFSEASKVAGQLAAANAAPTERAWISGTRAVLREIANDAVNVFLYVLPEISVHRVGIVGLPRNGYIESFDLTHVSFAGQLPKSLEALGYSPR